jgi:hypothetical protein
MAQGVEGVERQIWSTLGEASFCNPTRRTLHAQPEMF